MSYDMKYHQATDTVALLNLHVPDDTAKAPRQVRTYRNWDHGRQRGNKILRDGNPPVGEFQDEASTSLDGSSIDQVSSEC